MLCAQGGWRRKMYPIRIGYFPIRPLTLKTLWRFICPVWSPSGDGHLGNTMYCPGQFGTAGRGACRAGATLSSYLGSASRFVLTCVHRTKNSLMEQCGEFTDRALSCLSTKATFITRTTCLQKQKQPVGRLFLRLF